LDEKEKFLVEEYTRNIPPPTRASSEIKNKLHQSDSGLFCSFL
jgi:hypothetical protein